MPTRFLGARGPRRRAIRSSWATGIRHAPGMDWDPWPPRHLVLRTPRLELRPDDDAGLFELAEEAYLGVHPPELMPFVTAWTDATPANRGAGHTAVTLGERAALAPESWTMHSSSASTARSSAPRRWVGPISAVDSGGRDRLVARPAHQRQRDRHRDAGGGAAVRLRPPRRDARPLRRVRRQPGVAARVGEARLPPGRHRGRRASRRARRGRAAAGHTRYLRRPDWTLRARASRPALAPVRARAFTDPADARRLSRG